LPSQFSYTESRTANKVCGFCRKPKGYEIAALPDLILLNVNLPKKNGFEILAEIRASQSLRSIPVVVFTSASVPTERTKALALGAEDYISKPKDLDGLFDELRSVWSRFLAGP
jgi:CheY-like chemotaxis protein